MLPKSIRNLFLFISLITEEPITAAWPLPRDGRKANKGADKNEAIAVRKKSCFFGLIFFMLSIFCFGNFVFFIVLIIKEEEPNNPESRGNKEEEEGKKETGNRKDFRLRLKLAIPRKPERKKISKARKLEFFSLKIKKPETKMRIINIIGFMYK